MNIRLYWLILSILIANRPAQVLADTDRQILEELRALKTRVVELEDKLALENDKKSVTSLEGMLTDKSSSPSTSYIRNIVSNTTIGGYASSEYEDFEDKNSTFDQHRFVLNISSKLHDKLDFYSELEYEHGAVIKGDEDSSGEIAVEQAWMQYDFNENLGLRTGVILVPFGRFNINHDDDLWNFTDRPVVARRIVPTTWSDAGIGLVGNYEIEESSTIGGELYVINGLDDGFSNGSGGLRGARSNRESDNNNNKAVVGRLTVSPALGQELGLSGYYGDYDEDGNAIGAWAADWLFTAGDISFLGEYASFYIDDGVNSDRDRAQKQNSGVFAELNYSFWLALLDNTFLGSHYENSQFIISGRYNYAKIDRRATSALDETGYVIGLAYRPVKSFVVKTEYQFNNGELERKDADGFIGSVAMGF